LSIGKYRLQIILPEIGLTNRRYYVKDETLQQIMFTVGMSWVCVRVGVGGGGVKVIAGLIIMDMASRLEGVYF